MFESVLAEPILIRSRAPVSTDPWPLVLDSLDAAVCAVDRDLRVRLVNRAWDTLADSVGRPEWRSERLLGRPVLEALDGGEHTGWAEICTRLLDGEEANFWTSMHLPRIEGQRWMTMAAHALIADGEVCGISFELTDNTDYKLTEEEAVKRRMELRGLFEVTQSISTIDDTSELFRRVTGHLGYLFEARICAIALHDPETGHLVTMTPAHGLDDDEARAFVVPMPLRADLEPATPGSTAPSYVLCDDLASTRDECRRLGDRWGVGSLLVAPLRHHGCSIGYLALAGPRGGFTDEAGPLLATFAGLIAAAIEASRLVLALQDRAEKVSAALADVQEVDRLKGELIQNVSHELRLPLMVIQGYADLVKTGAFGSLGPELQRAIDVISDKAALLGKLVGDIVVLRGLNQADLQLAPMSLAELARDAVDRARPGAADNRVLLKADIVPETLPLRADRRRMEQVVDELLGNAIKFSPDGGEVGVTVRQGGDVVYLKVSDRGIGIPPSQIHRIWDRFYQFDGSTTRRFGGSGVGLAVVKQIVEAHGGQVWVESQEGHGSQFYVALRMSPNASGEIMNPGVVM